MKYLHQSEDLELIQKCENGDKKAFDELVLKYQTKAFNVAYRMLSNYEEAKDITQEAFLKAYQSMRGFRKDACFYTWLYRILINTCKNKMKNWARHPHVESLDSPVQTAEGDVIRTLPDKEPDPDQLLIKRETQRCVREAIDSLAIKYKAVIILRDIEGLSYKEITESIGCREGTIKSRLSRARIILKEKLKEVNKNGL